MIVCQCNVILKQEVREAASRLLALDPSATLSPQLIYKDLQKRGRCCSCFPTVAKIVDELLDGALDEVDGSAIFSPVFRRTLEPKDA